MSEALRDFANINSLRLELKRADAIYTSPGTHALLKRTLGDIWRVTVEHYTDRKKPDPKEAAKEAAKDAAIFLLTERPVFGGKNAFDFALSGEDEYQQVRAYVGKFIHGVYM
jgi:hypothetical protein